MSEHWNYVDALSYALALNAPERIEFSADPSKWHTAVYRLRENFREKMPEVFSHIFFDVRYGQPPYSREVDHMLHVLAQARLLSEPNPSYLVLGMNATQRNAILQLNEGRLQDKKPILEELGKELLSELKSSAA